MNDYVQDPILLKSPTNVFGRRERMPKAIPYALAKPRPPVMEQRSALWYIHTADYCAAIPKNEAAPYIRRWKKNPDKVLSLGQKRQRADQ